MNEQNQQPQVIYLRGYRVDLQHHALLNEGGAVVELRPQALDLLCLLAQNAGKVMEKQDLLAQVWKGLFVTDDSLVQAIGDIRRAIDDQGHQMIRTVPRRGYRLIEHVPGGAGPDTVSAAENPTEAVPMEHIAVVPNIVPAPTPTLQTAQVAPANASSDQKGLTSKWVIWLAALLLMIGAVYLVWNKQATGTAPPRLSIVVLPFVNSSGDASKDYIADSVTEDVTVQLSRIKGSFVIGRGTAFTYKGKAVDLKALAKDLNVRYVLKGTVDRSDAGYHITAQLVDGVSGSNLWADALDIAVDKKGDIRQWVAARITNLLRVQLVQAEATQSAKLASPASEDLDMQGYSKYLACYNKETCLEAHRLFTKAIELDPQNSTARAHRIPNMVGLFQNEGVPQSGEILAQFNSDIAHLEGLVALDANGHRALARARYRQGRNEEALQHINAMLEMDPNDVDALRNKPVYLILNGQAAEAIPVARKAMELSPKDPFRDDFYFYTCHAYMHLGQFKEAVAWCEKAFATFSYFWPLVDLVSAYTALGDTEKAAVTKEKLMAMKPDFSIGWYKALKLSSNPIWLKEIEENSWANLRKAGIPE
jgi:TolB-like protein/DNA-binding winged helix-turn-helix (wHTH) protein